MPSPREAKQDALEVIDEIEALFEMWKGQQITKEGNDRIKELISFIENDICSLTF